MVNTRVPATRSSCGGSRLHTSEAVYTRSLRAVIGEGSLSSIGVELQLRAEGGRSCAACGLCLERCLRSRSSPRCGTAQVRDSSVPAALHCVHGSLPASWMHLMRSRRHLRHATEVRLAFGVTIVLRGSVPTSKSKHRRRWHIDRCTTRGCLPDPAAAASHIRTSGRRWRGQ